MTTNERKTGGVTGSKDICVNAANYRQMNLDVVVPMLVKYKLGIPYDKCTQEPLPSSLTTENVNKAKEEKKKAVDHTTLSRSALIASDKKVFNQRTAASRCRRPQRTPQQLEEVTRGYDVGRNPNKQGARVLGGG